jgi:hypothetical protein
MKYIVTSKVMSRNRPGFPSWTMGWVDIGLIFDDVNSVSGWIAIAPRKWIPAYACEPYAYIPPVTPPSLGGLWRTKPGNQKLWGYKPEGINYGSFDIGWILPERPAGFINKPAGFKLLPAHIEYLKILNGGDEHKVNWLIDRNGTRKILSQEESGQYKCPVPCYSGNNPVNVLEIDGNFARIETVSIYQPLPPTLPDYLCHEWWAFTSGGKYYRFLDEEGGIKYALFARSTSAWVQLSGIIKP